MNGPNSTVSNVSDTARWVVYFRARNATPGAPFRDPYVERLAGLRMDQSVPADEPQPQ